MGARHRFFPDNTTLIIDANATFQFQKILAGTRSEPLGDDDVRRWGVVHDIIMWWSRSGQNRKILCRRWGGVGCVRR